MPSSKFNIIMMAMIGFLVVACANHVSDSNKKPPRKDQPLKHNHTEETTPITVLSLDGGGIRGIILAHLLAGIEEKTGKQIYRLFDVIAGTSTGGLIALLLTSSRNGSPMSAKEIEQLYRDKASTIFTKSCRFPKLVCGATGPMYTAKPLEGMLHDIFGEQSFSSSLTRTLITVFDIEAKLGFALESDSSRFDNLTNASVARATSAAPTYFPPKMIDLKSAQGDLATHYLVDGGLYKNNPSILAYRKAERLFGADQVEARGILLVSLGTGRPVLITHQGNTLLTAGLAEWAPLVVDSMIEGTSREDHWILKELFRLNPRFEYVRLQTVLNNVDHPDIMDLDNVEEANINELVNAAAASMFDKKYDKIIRLLKEARP